MKSNMKKEMYESIFQHIKATRYGKQLVALLGMAITGVTAMLYFGVGIYLLWQGRYIQTVPLVLVPAISFVAVSILRKGINAKRPYEMYDFTPLIPKDKKGQSFPSRHVFSIFVIAMSISWYCKIIAVVIGIMGIVLAALRVVTGVHFPKDVLAGMILGILCGSLVGLF